MLLLDQWGSSLCSTTESTHVTYPYLFDEIRNVLVRTASTVFIPISIDLDHDGFNVYTIKVGNSSATQYKVLYLAIGVKLMTST